MGLCDGDLLCDGANITKKEYDFFGASWILCDLASIGIHCERNFFILFFFFYGTVSDSIHTKSRKLHYLFGLFNLRKNCS